MKITGSLALELKAELKVTYKRDGELADINGGGKTEVSITGTPQLESGPHLWVENEMEWKPLHVHLEAKLRYPDNGQKLTTPGRKLTPGQVEGDKKRRQ